MKKALLLFSLFIFLFPGFTSAEQMLNITQIIKLTYSHDVYLSYENSIPIFYVDQPQKFKIDKVIVYSPDKDIQQMLVNLGFVVDKSKYDILISRNPIDVNGSIKAIFLSPLPGSEKLNNTVSRILWKVDPLGLKYSYVETLYALPNKGTVIAKYQNGKIAAVRIGNRIYLGFEPTSESLANLIMTFAIKEVNSTPATEEYVKKIIVINVISATTTALGFSLFFFPGKVQLISLKLKTKLKKLEYSFVLFRYKYIGREVLKNETRARMYEFIKQEGYATLNDICSNFNIPRTTVKWHLLMLTRTGLVKSEKICNTTVFYLPNMRDIAIAKFLLKSETRKRIYELLYSNELGISEIARILNLSKSTVHYEISLMQKFNIVEKTEANKFRVVRIFRKGFTYAPIQGKAQETA